VSARWYYNRNRGGWPEDLYEQIGLPELVEKFPSDVLDLGMPVGQLSPHAAEELGLEPRTVVGQGGVDAFVGMIGLGVVDPSRVAFITGSSHLVLGLSEEEFHTKGIWGAYPDAVIKGLSLVEGGQSATGSMLNWFRRTFCVDLEKKSADTGPSVYDYLTHNARDIAPGSEGLLVCDWFQGQRSPHTDANVRGMIYGLSLRHSRAHLFKAMMEGIAYGTENILRVFRANGIAAQELYVGGGATNNDFFLQVHADVSNIPIHVPRETQAPSLGSAILAGVAAGWFPDPATGARQMVSFDRTIEPDSERHQKYREVFEFYARVYPEFHDWMQDYSVRGGI
jgi:ribulose kinase